MFDDLATYYYENVVSSFTEYYDICNNGSAGRSRDLRAALNAASALYHLREHLPGKVPSRANIERLCPEYAILGDVVNASKHKVLKSPTPHGASLVNNAENLREKIIFIEYEDEAGKYRYVQKTVVVQLTDGLERSLLEILTNVINFWESYMLSLGVLKKARVYTYDSGIRFRSRTECDVTNINFEMVQGLRFKQTMQFLKFDNATGKAEPFDFTGSNVRFRVYAPRYIIELALQIDASEKKYRTEITLTQEESIILSSMSDDQERRTYINNLPAVQVAIQNIIAKAGLSKT